MHKLVSIAALGAILLVGPSCATNAQTGVLVGAAGGAAAGGAVGAAAGNTVAGIIIGAVVGGAAGGIIGDYMDRQAAEMDRDLEGATVERIGEGIKITFDAGILFDVDRSELHLEAEQELDRLATILNKYDDTNIIIEGHTDATGAEDYNQRLSERRAQSVATHLATQTVDSRRFSVNGWGETQPVASNETADGRQQNRRVDLAIIANDKLKAAAERQARGDR
jgi:outer membrane protein OmpA-like peptidoglycan-associated protein